MADLAFAASHPRIDEANVSHFDALHIRPECHDLADILVTHRQRKLDAAIGEHQLLAAADLVIAVPDVQVGVAHAGREHFQQHLRARGLRRLGLVHLQWRAALADLKTAHFHFWFLPALLSSRPSQRVRAKRGPMTGSARAGIHRPTIF